MTSAFVLIDKQQGETSAQTVAAVRRLFAGIKGGHTGTLDPMATGLLLVALGEASGFIRFMRDDKQYHATVRFGAISDTDDAWGKLSAPQKTPNNLTAQVRTVLPDFIGEIKQEAPRHSALKFKGKPLYYYARNNIPVPVKQRLVRVHNLTWKKTEGNDLTFIIRCGGGFYVRSLARELGKRIGCGAHLLALRRLDCASFNITQAQTVAALSATPTSLQQLLPIETAVAHLPCQAVDNAYLWALAQGQHNYSPDEKTEKDKQLVRLHSSAGRFAGVALRHNTHLLPQKLLSWTRTKS